MTNLTDYDVLVSVQSELDKLRKDYNNLTLENLKMKELLKRCQGALLFLGEEKLLGEIDKTIGECDGGK